MPWKSVIGPAFDDPPAERTVIRADPLAHALDDLLRRAASAADVAHHLRVAVEGHEGGLVRRAKAAQAKASGSRASVSA